MLVVWVFEMKGAVGGVFDDADAQLGELRPHEVAFRDVGMRQGQPLVVVAHAVVVEDVQVDGAAAIDGGPVLDAGLRGPAELALDGLQLVQQFQRRQVGAEHQGLVQERGRIETPGDRLRDAGAALNAPRTLRHPHDGSCEVAGAVAQIAAQTDDCPFYHSGGKDKKNARIAGIVLFVFNC